MRRGLRGRRQQGLRFAGFPLLLEEIRERYDCGPISRIPVKGVAQRAFGRVPVVGSVMLIRRHASGDRVREPVNMVPTAGLEPARPLRDYGF